MQPVAVSPEAERGYYVIWNAETWARMRVSSVAHVLRSCADPPPQQELTLYYADLETFPELPPGPHS